MAPVSVHLVVFVKAAIAVNAFRGDPGQTAERPASMVSPMGPNVSVRPPTEGWAARAAAGGRAETVAGMGYATTPRLVQGSACATLGTSALDAIAPKKSVTPCSPTASASLVPASAAASRSLPVPHVQSVRHRRGGSIAPRYVLAATVYATAAMVAASASTTTSTGTGRGRSARPASLVITPPAASRSRRATPKFRAFNGSTPTRRWCLMRKIRFTSMRRTP